MSFLLDTNVVSELRKVGGGRADPQVTAWQQTIRPLDLHLSVITLMEIEMGILSIARRDTAQGDMLRQWFDGYLRPGFEGRILPVDEAAAARCAAIHTPDRRPERDALIGATALVHGMTLVTRNTRDFEQMGVRLLDPWQAVS